MFIDKINYKLHFVFILKSNHKMSFFLLSKGKLILSYLSWRILPRDRWRKERESCRLRSWIPATVEPWKFPRWRWRAYRRWSRSTVVCWRGSSSSWSRSSPEKWGCRRARRGRRRWPRRRTTRTCNLERVRRPWTRYRTADRRRTSTSSSSLLWSSFPGSWSLSGRRRWWSSLESSSCESRSWRGCPAKGLRMRCWSRRLKMGQL